MKSLGFICGIMLVVVVTAVIGLLITKGFNTDNEVKTKYDERQRMVRGDAYKYAFWTLIGLFVVSIALKAAEIELPIQDDVLFFIFILIGVMVHTTYCIFNDGYFGINNKPRQYYIFFVFIGIFNILIGVSNAVRNGLMEDGKLATPSINLLCGLMFVVLAICIIIKRIISKNEEEGDDEES